MAIPTNRPSGNIPRPRPSEDLPSGGLPSLDDLGRDPVQERLDRLGGLPNPSPPEEDDPFTSLSPSDDSLYEGDDEFDLLPVPTKPSAGRSEPPPAYRTSTPPTKSLASLLEEEDEESLRMASQAHRAQASDGRTLPRGYTDDTFIDEKNMRLKPFGRTTGRRARVGEFDSRKNLRQRSKMVQWVVIGLLLILVLLGIKNSLLPPASLSKAEVETIVAESMGDQGFPLTWGAGFAQDFLQAYLTQSSDPNAKTVLEYFYGGVEGGGGGANITNSYYLKQTIVSGPTLYNMRARGPSSANYVFAVLLDSSSTYADDAEAMEEATRNGKAKTTYFNVNVYYNAEGDYFVVDPESPTVTSPVTSGGSKNLPDSDLALRDTASQEEMDAARPVVVGFMKGYAVSTPVDHINLDQYIVPDPPAALLQGLGKRYQLSGADEQGVQFTLYTTEVPGVLEAEVKVTWREQISSTVYQDIPSVYLMTLEKQANGKYLVSNFTPKYFFPAP